MIHPSTRVLAAAIRANVPALLWGNPGLGKSAQIESWGLSWGFHVETVVGSNREATDFLGLPTDRNGSTGYLTLGWAERLCAADRGLLFLDEFSTSEPDVQKAMLRVLQERYVGETLLPKTVAIVAAANPPDVAVDGWDIAAPVANRLIHIDWHFDDENWHEGFVSGFEFTEAPDFEEILSPKPRLLEARGAVSGFLKTRPDLLAPKPPSNPVHAGRGWTSPRSWTNFAEVMAQLRENDSEAIMVAAIGCVGEAAGKEFTQWLLTADLYNVDEVLADPSIVDWTARPDRIYALVLSLAAIARIRGDKETWKKSLAALTACAKNSRPDLAYPGVRALVKNIPEGGAVPRATTEAFRDLFEATGRWSASDAA